MHELGIMTGVVEGVTKAALDSGAVKVLRVDLRVGVMTEAVEDALRFAFEVLTERDPFFEGAELGITMVEPKSVCTMCGHEFRHDRFHVLCPECGGMGRIVEGKELSIDSIEVDMPDDNSSDTDSQE